MDWIELQIDDFTVLRTTTDAALVVQKYTGKPIVSDRAGVFLTVEDRSKITVTVYRRPEKLRLALLRWWQARRSKLSGTEVVTNSSAWTAQAAKPNQKSTGQTG